MIWKIALGFGIWFVIAIPISILVGRRLNKVSKQYPVAKKREPSCRLRDHVDELEERIY